MQIVRFNDLKFIPASHENPKNPGAFKKILLKRDDLPAGRIQMINWAKIPRHKTFSPHYHEKMIEVFIIMNGKVKVKVDHEEAILEKGDMLIVKEDQVHTFENISNQDVNYFAMGIVTSEGGKTINI
ncbi:cupin domain-containing protein [Candidatus Daviesbacteria bacterium]|nr:cupin domain-containing protein [Candidatus Daviesbacteria bacterium]